MKRPTRVEETQPRRPTRITSSKKESLHRKRLRRPQQTTKVRDSKWVKQAIYLRRKLQNDIENDISAHLDPSRPRTLLSLIELLWGSQSSNSKDGFVLPNRKELHGDFKASWELMFSTLEELELWLTKLVPPFSSKSWLINMPTFLEPKPLDKPKPKEFNFVQTNFPDFVPPPAPIQASETVYIPKLIRIPELTLPQLPEFRCETENQGLDQANNMLDRLRQEVTEALGEHNLDSLNNWRNYVVTNQWVMYNFSTLFKENEEAINIQMPSFKPPRLKQIPKFIEPTLKFKAERGEILNLSFEPFKPDLEEDRNKLYESGEATKFKESEREYVFKRWINRAQKRLLKPEKDHADFKSTFHQIQHLKIKGFSHWRAFKSDFSADQGYLVILEPCKNIPVSFNHDMGKDPIIQVSLSRSNELSSKVIVEGITNSGFQLTIDYDAEDEEIEVLIVRWRALSNIWTVSGALLVTDDVYLWTPSSSLSKNDCSKANCKWEFADYPAFMGKIDPDIVQNEVFSSVNGETIIQKADLSTMRMYAPPSSFQAKEGCNKVKTYQGYKMMIIIDGSQHMKKHSRWLRLKNMLLHFLNPSYGGVHRICGNGGAFNISILLPNMNIKRFDDKNFVTLDGSKTVLTEIHKWVSELKAPNYSDRVNTQELLQKELRWVSTKRVHAVHFVTCQLESFSVDKNLIQHMPPVHVISFEVIASSRRKLVKTLMSLGGTLEELEDLTELEEKNYRGEYVNSSDKKSTLFAPNGDDLESILCTNEAPLMVCVNTVSNKEESTEADNELKEKQRLYDKHYRQEEVKIRESNRYKLISTKRKYVEKIKTSIENENVNRQQDRIRCIVWRWNTMAELIYRRGLVTLLNLFCAAASMRARDKKRQMIHNFTMSRSESINCASDILSTILNDVFADAYDKIAIQRRKESEEIEKGNQIRIENARKAHAEEIKRRLEIFDSPESRKKRNDFRDTLFKEYTMKVEKIKDENAKIEEIAKKKHQDAIVSVKIKATKVEILQIFEAVRQKSKLNQQMLTQCYFKAASGAKPDTYNVPHEPSGLIFFFPIVSHETRRKGIKQEIVLYSHALEREYHTAQERLQEFINDVIKSKLKERTSQCNLMKASISNDNANLQNQFEAALSQEKLAFKAAVTSLEQQYIRQHKGVIVTGWNLSIKLFKNCKSHERRQILAEMENFVKMIELLKAMDVLDESQYFKDDFNEVVTKNCEESFMDMLFDKNDEFNRLLFVVLRLRCGKLNPFAARAFQRSSKLEEFNMIKRQQARNVRKLLLVKFECSIEGFPLVFENESRKLLQKCRKNKQIEKVKRAHEKVIESARREWEQQRKNIKVKLEQKYYDEAKEHEKLLKDLEIKNQERYNTAQADYDANIVSVVKEYNNSVQHMEERTKAARAEISLIQRFRHELELHKPKFKRFKTVPTSLLRRALHSAFKPHTAGSGINACRTL